MVQPVEIMATAKRIMFRLKWVRVLNVLGVTRKIFVSLLKNASGSVRCRAVRFGEQMGAEKESRSVQRQPAIQWVLPRSDSALKSAAVDPNPDPSSGCPAHHSPAVNDMLSNVADLRRPTENVCVCCARCQDWGIQLHFAYWGQIMSDWRREATSNPRCLVVVLLSLAPSGLCCE